MKQTRHKANPCFSSFQAILIFLATLLTCLNTHAQELNLKLPLENTGEIDYAMFSPDGKMILTTSISEGTGRLWHSQTGDSIFTLKYPNGVLPHAVFSPDGNTILTLWGWQAQLWNRKNGKFINVLAGDDQCWLGVYSPDSKTILTGHASGPLLLWDGLTGDSISSIGTKEEESSGYRNLYFYSAAFSPDGKTILTASDDSTARLWDSQTGDSLLTLRHTDEVESAVFSPDGKTILTGSYDNTAKLWDSHTGDPMLTLRHTDDVYSVVFSPDGKTILTVPDDSTARLWDSQTGNRLLTLKHDAWVRTADFSPNGNAILTRSGDDTVKLWNSKNGYLILSVDKVESAVFSPDGSKILTTSSDGSVQLWDSQTGDLLIRRVQLENGEWLDIDRFGRFDGTPEALDYLYFTCGAEIIDLSQVKDALWVPGLYEKIMTGRKLLIND